MPHLSPMYWLSAITAFYLSLMIIMASLWWHTPPKFPLLTPSPKDKQQTTSNIWKWN